jgi:hypothetical protein
MRTLEIIDTIILSINTTAVIVLAMIARRRCKKN